MVFDHAYESFITIQRYNPQFGTWANIGIPYDGQTGETYAELRLEDLNGSYPNNTYRAVRIITEVL